MLEVTNRRALILIATAFVSGPFSSRVLAEKREVVPRPLVIVGDGHDVECVRRIAGMAVEVRLLFAKGITPGDYARCAAWVRRGRRFSVYLANAASHCPYERFWRDRLARDNPRGQVLCVSHCRTSADNRFRAAAQRAIALHRVLVSALPKHRHAFDTNLAIELDRLHRDQVQAVITLAGSSSPSSSRQVHTSMHARTREGS